LGDDLLLALIYHPYLELLYLSAFVGNFIQLRAYVKIKYEYGSTPRPIWRK